MITGITGQDGAYLAEFLLEKGYGSTASSAAPPRSTPIASTISTRTRTSADVRLHLHYGDLTDSTNLIRIVQQVQPDEIYNLAAQSHVAVSFETPEYTANADALGTLRLLEAIRILGLERKTRFYQASTSELYGMVQETPQRETTPFYPRSPYGAAKLYAYWITVNYREAYGIYACNGILFNHESPVRGETFVTRKITRALARIHVGLQDMPVPRQPRCERDWGHARDYVEVQWLMLQQDAARRLRHRHRRAAHGARVRRARAAASSGMRHRLAGQGSSMRRRRRQRARHRAVDPRYFRPTEVETLLGRRDQGPRKLGWKPRHYLSPSS